jgi:hypothetical protein
MEAAGGRQSVRADGGSPEDTHTQAVQASAVLIERQASEALIELQALLDIFRQCGGSSWECRTRWGSAKPVHTWYGVGCDRDGRVVTLEVVGNELRGAK